MRAAVMRGRKMLAGEIAAPRPGPGEVLVKTLACGICGSDLHAFEHFDEFTDPDNGFGSGLDAGGYGVHRLWFHVLPGDPAWSAALLAALGQYPAAAGRD